MLETLTSSMNSTVSLARQEAIKDKNCRVNQRRSARRAKEAAAAAAASSAAALEAGAATHAANCLEIERLRLRTTELEEQIQAADQAADSSSHPTAQELRDDRNRSMAAATDAERAARYEACAASAIARAKVLIEWAIRRRHEAEARSQGASSDGASSTPGTQSRGGQIEESRRLLEDK